MIQAVQTEARETALVRWDAAGDVFVWRARRCAEAVLYAVLCREGVDIDAIAKQRKGLDGLIEHKQLEGALSRETRAQLVSLREFGNIAAHYQLTGGVSEASVDAMGQLLAALLREFYDKDGGAPPEALQPYLAALTDRRARILSAAEIEGDRARRRARELEARLQVVHVESAATLVTASRDRGSRNVATLLGIAMVGSLLGYFAGRKSAAPAAESSVTALATIPVRPTAPDPPRGDEPPASPTPPPAPAPPAPETPSTLLAIRDALAEAEVACPPTMVRVGDGCLDVGPVLMRSYRECVRQRRCERPRPGAGCNWQNGLDDLAANCVSWTMARAYCRWAHPDRGDVPTPSMWSVARRPGVRLRSADETREWGVAPDGEEPLIGDALRAPRPRWSPAGREQGLRDVGFRCALNSRAASP